MGTPQNPIAHQNRPHMTNPSPGPNPVPAQAPKVPSFEEVSGLFSLPLSDAAESLGVSTSVLKTVCYENGLVRWPHRQFVAGKSIEEIKKEAAMEKEKQISASKKKSDSVSGFTVSSSLQHQSTGTGSPKATPASRIGLQQVNKSNLFESSKGVQGTSMNRGSFDEFKYGFPSEGLSTVSYRWWRNKASSNVDGQKGASDSEHSEESKQQTPSTEPYTSVDDVDVTEGKESEKQAETQCAASLLRSLREKAARDSEKALKLGVYRGCYNVKKLDKSKQRALLQIFQSSLPSEWVTL